MNGDSGWPGDWLRGVLDLCVLAVLSRGPAHGYAITQALEAAGLGRIKGGTVYPLLARLEADGMVTSRWHAGDGGPGRKVIAITDHGRDHLTERGLAFRRFSQTAIELVTGDVATAAFAGTDRGDGI